MLREVAQPNVGIVVDALHFHRSRVQLQELEALPREWFHFMHLCDTGKEIPTDPKILAHDGREERLYPGEGAVDLKGILSKLPEEIVRGIEVPHSKRLQEAGFEAHARRGAGICQAMPGVVHQRIEEEQGMRINSLARQKPGSGADGGRM